MKKILLSVFLLVLIFGIHTSGRADIFSDALSSAVASVEGKPDPVEIFKKHGLKNDEEIYEFKKAIISDTYKFADQQIHEKAIAVYEEIKNISPDDLRKDPATQRTAAYREFGIIKIKCKEYTAAWDRAIKEKEAEEARKTQELEEQKAQEEKERVEGEKAIKEAKANEFIQEDGFEEKNKVIARLKECPAGVVHYGAFNSFGTSMWNLLIEVQLFNQNTEVTKMKQQLSFKDSVLQLKLKPDKNSTWTYYFYVSNYAILQKVKAIGIDVDGTTINTEVDVLEGAAFLTQARETLYKENKPTKEQAEKVKKALRKVFE